MILVSDNNNIIIVGSPYNPEENDLRYSMANLYYL